MCYNFLEVLVSMKKYNVDDVVTGTVTGIEKYGIFLSIDEESSGLIHISEVSNSFVSDLNDYVNMDETIKAKVIEVDDGGKHLKLSIKDFDYRINKRHNNHIVETKHGFNTLKEKLPGWIDETLDKIQKRD